eukprot:4477758-Alexandrium_andersonii.AAC.1
MPSNRQAQSTSKADPGQRAVVDVLFHKCSIDGREHFMARPGIYGRTMMLKHEGCPGEQGVFRALVQPAPWTISMSWSM